MSVRNPWTEDQLVWHIPMFDKASTPDGNPTFDPPAAWVRALEAVAHDLRYLRYGRNVRIDRLTWEFGIDTNYSVHIGWDGRDGIGGFGLCEGLSMDAPFAEAAVWVAETVQWDLAGYEFVQWPSRGHHLLIPRLRAGTAVWINPHADVTVARVGELSANVTGFD
ncbi:hypothetical protein FOS14_22660 [Skermania sp. ID1734]|uniref:hypothetical protein n=1 Tax=Skermania sp. ID1734 TaxID=2597516 RepID=UPI001180E01E|nr:hypothetical protein [Skermania sp. ID1734]TSD93659.1 hypothetical protein FOS14_22660 [Skermania sp. ID1734]